MKRIVNFEIHNCYECPLLSVNDEFNFTEYECLETSESVKNFETKESDEQARAATNKWFNDCTKWSVSNGI